MGGCWRVCDRIQFENVAIGGADVAINGDAHECCVCARRPLNDNVQEK